MLNSRQIQEHLKRWSIKNGDKRQLAAIGKLPARLRPVGFAVLERDPQGKAPGRKERETFYWALGQRQRELDELNARDRTALFKALCGRLAAAIDLTWEHLKHGTYQVGYARRPFRAPHDASATFEVRLSCLQSIATLSAEISEEVLTPQWLAAWSPFLHSSDDCARLFAAVIDDGGESGSEVFEVLYLSATNDHEIGQMGDHVIRGLLSAAREDGWQLVENLLLAAQRQEGLRQAILETVDEAHPMAFRRMLRLIVDQKLARFSAVTRAVDVWLGMCWDSASVKTVNDAAATILRLLDDPQARAAALAGTDAEQVYFALWATAHGDVSASSAAAARLLEHAAAEVRFVAVKHLADTQLHCNSAALSRAMLDEDLRIAMQAVQAPGGLDVPTPRQHEDQQQRFVALAKLFERLPAKPKPLAPLVWPWMRLEARRGIVALNMVHRIGDLPATRLLPYISQFDSHARFWSCRLLAEQKPWDQPTREALLQLVGDSSPSVRAAATEAFRADQLTADEAQRIEGFLTRKTADLRHNVVQLLLGQSDDAARQSAERLLGAKNANQRHAGLEILRQLTDKNRAPQQCRSLALAYQQRPRLSKDEQSQLDAILATTQAELTLENGFGLFDPAERSPRTAPKLRKAQRVTAAAVKLLQSLDKLVHKHRDVPASRRQNLPEEPLGGLKWGFWGPLAGKPVSDQLDAFPLADIWLAWERDRPKTLRDPDGLEMLRAAIACSETDKWWAQRRQQWLKRAARRPIAEVLNSQKLPKLKYPAVIQSVLRWLIALQASPQGIDLCLDFIESVFAMIPDSDQKRLPKLDRAPQDFLARARGLPDDWRDAHLTDDCFDTLDEIARAGTEFSPQQHCRLWKLLHWFEEPIDGAPRMRASLDQMLNAYAHGGATLADLMDHLIGPEQTHLRSLALLTSPRPETRHRQFLEAHPEVSQALNRIRERVVELELARGELPTPATALVRYVETLHGAATLLKLLDALGQLPFRAPSDYTLHIRSKQEALTQLIRSTYPSPDDSPADFKRLTRAAVKSGAYPEERLLQLAFLAPQWTRFVQEYFGWSGFQEALYWFMAHMGGALSENALYEAASEGKADAPDAKQNDDSPITRIQNLTERFFLERTPLSTQDRRDGAIDVDWFHRAYQGLGSKRWQVMAGAARYAATPAQAKHAQLLGDVLLGKGKKGELVANIKNRKLKESVRLLGLLPLAKGPGQAKDIDDRYQVLQEYRQYANGLSGLTRPSALRSYEIGMRNLAQLAGYPDPLRLQWALEARATSDLLAGPVVVAQGDVSLTLTLDDRAQPQLTIDRGGKPLKSLPASHKKLPAFAQLAERGRELKRQAARVRKSLETAMCRGDVFSGEELATITRHALLKPMLERLVLVGEGIMGYPDKNGKALRGYDGKLEPVKKREQLRIAHPADLLSTGKWDAWQRDCFEAERLQPFKQIFRELYVVTRQELADGTHSNRYAGQQVNPQQANALLTQRDWNVGDWVFKVFHGQGITATVEFDDGIATPLEVEGLTLDLVQFRRSDDGEPVPLKQVPPRIFSEVMRDLDLVVSVAHRGGVDPEASASTVEMRGSLLRETCALLGLENVTLNKSHARIRGRLAEYTVHLGSGVVHRLPGGALCLVPVHAQHRGRLFLPFADDDPKTAEVISKVLLLARDHQIQDPSILEQLRAAV